MEELSTTTPTTTPTTNQDTQKAITENVQANALNLTLSALSAALGDIKVLRLTPTTKNSLKYEIIRDENEILKALSWIAKYGHGRILPVNVEDPQLQYFILQQGNTNMNAWNALIDRDLGKVPNESKIDFNATFDLEAIGQKAIEQRKRQVLDNATKAMVIPASWVTPE